MPRLWRATETGANAVIGIDLDYETVGQNGSMLMVTASGTAVVALRNGMGRQAAYLNRFCARAPAGERLYMRHAPPRSGSASAYTVACSATRSRAAPRPG
jgi:hypothetical protein